MADLPPIQMPPPRVPGVLWYVSGVATGWMAALIFSALLAGCDEFAPEKRTHQDAQTSLVEVIAVRPVWADARPAIPVYPPTMPLSVPMPKPRQP